MICNAEAWRDEGSAGKINEEKQRNNDDDNNNDDFDGNVGDLDIFFLFVFFFMMKCKGQSVMIIRRRKNVY